MTATRAVQRLERQVAAALARSGYDTAATTLVVAVSGGPDSTTLLLSLHRVGQPLGLHLHVAHLIHDLRGAETEEDAAFVSDLANRLGLPVTIQRADPLEYQRQCGISSFEQATRQLRYDFLRTVALERSAPAVAVGHTRDDQAETVLEHILRGSGIHGLRGMTETALWPWPAGVDDVLLLRPLLPVSRSGTEGYCRELGQPFRRDSENDSPKFTRNRIRHDLLPRLASEYNPRVADALVRLSRNAAVDLDFLEQECDRIWPLVASSPASGNSGDGGLNLDRQALRALHPALQRSALRRAFITAAGDARRLQETHLAGMAALAQDKSAGNSLRLPRGWWLHASHDRLVLTPAAEFPCPLPPITGSHPLTLPTPAQPTVSPVIGGWRVTAELAPWPGNGPAGKQGPNVAFFRRDALAGPVVVRCRVPGDRFHPLGMAGEKKLQDFFTDAKVPAAWRDLVPLVTAGPGIAWVVGHRIAEWAKVVPDGADNTTALRLEFAEEVFHVHQDERLGDFGTND